MRAAAGLVVALLIAAAPVRAADEPPPREVVDEAVREITAYEHFVRPSTATPAQVELGRALFFEKRLSKKGLVSCATCHDPSKAFADGRPRARGLALGPRNTPSLLTAAYYKRFTWDGKAVSPADASLQAIANPLEMGLPVERAVARLRGSYAARFASAYPGRGLSARTLGEALEAFTLAQQAPEDSPFDRFAKTGQGLSAAEQRGLVLYASKAGCRNCHSSLAFTDNRFRNIGVRPAAPVDLGRYPLDPRLDNWEAFRTPTLRNVALTAPYMHDGSLATLDDVVDFYDRGGDEQRGTDRDLPSSLGLTQDEKADLVAFLRALTSETRPAAAGVAPEPPPEDPSAGLDRPRIAADLAPAAAADLDRLSTEAAGWLDRLDGLLDAYAAWKPAPGRRALSRDAGRRYCEASPLALTDAGALELTLFRACGALARRAPQECGRMGQLARASLDDINDCNGMYRDLALVRSLAVGAADYPRTCAEALRWRKPGLRDDEAASACELLRGTADATAACAEIARRLPERFPTAERCLHALALYRGQACDTYRGFDYQQRLCRKAAGAARARSPEDCGGEFVCRFVRGDDAACDAELARRKAEYCAQAVGVAPGETEPASAEFVSRLAAVVVDAADEPLRPAERRAAERLNAFLLRQQPFEPGAALDAAALLRSEHAGELLSRARAIVEALGPASEPRTADRVAALERRRDSALARLDGLVGARR